MQTITKTFEKIKDKLTSKERVVLIYACSIGSPLKRSIAEIAQLFGANKEDILEVLQSAFRKYPKEITAILNLN